MTLALLICGALLVGIAKTSIGGIVALPVMMFALAMPTKESTGAVLITYLAGDLIAVYRYRHSVRWRLLLELVPWVVPGLVLGAWFLTVSDGDTLRLWIGGILLVSVALHIALSWRQRRAEGLDGPKAGPGVRWAGTIMAGLASGFATMAANTGGPVMTLYLLAKRVDKLAFVGTAAWFFLVVNLIKLPFSIAVEAITPQVVWTILPLVPVVWLGCAIGIWLLKLIPQRLFNGLTLASTALAAVLLLVPR